MGLWLRWCWRDFRRQWVPVVSIALVVAFGVGVFASLKATTAWREESNAASFERLRLHDVRLSLDHGRSVPTGALRAAVAPLADRGLVDAAVERLVVRVQVDASRYDERAVVPGRLVAAGAALGRAGVDDVAVRAGGLPGDGGDAPAVLEYHFAKHYDLPPRGEVGISGSRTVRYAGQALAPEYFVVTGEEAALLAESNFAVLFTSLADGQRLTGRAGVNELVLRWRDGVDPVAARDELRRLAAANLPGVAVALTAGEDEESARILREDVAQDDELWTVVALLILGCSCFAVVNLTRRIVEAQRREIGIGMALGMSRRQLAARPLVTGAQIAVLGAAGGLALGGLGQVAVGAAFRALLPLPVWRQDFQPGVFAAAAALGVLMPLVAAAYPVLRAVRVPPVTAIRVGRHPVRAGRLVSRASRLPLPGSALRQLPLRNVLRAPVRSALTVLGVAAAITAMVGSVGMLDSMNHTVDAGERELTRLSPSRVRVELDRFAAPGSRPLGAIRTSPLVGAAEFGLRLDGTASRGGTSIDLLLQVQDLTSPIWAPTVRRAGGVLPALPAVVLSAKAARELGVRPGDRISLRHPVYDGDLVPRDAVTEAVVAGLHPAPLRLLAFMPLRDAALFGLDGYRNYAEVVPAPGRSETEVVRAMAAVPGVATAQPVTALSRVFRNFLRTVVPIFRVVQIAVLLMAVVVAVNASRLTIDERMRENATLIACGLRVPRVVRMLVAESFVVGLAGTAIGLGLGFAIVRWTVRDMLSATLPEIDLLPYLSASTLVAAVIVGLTVVALAPMLSTRRLRRTDLPGALRVVE